MSKQFSDPEAVVDDIIREVGTRLVVGLPLGLGKANHIVNALYQRAAADRADRPHAVLGADPGKAEAGEPAWKRASAGRWSSGCSAAIRISPMSRRLRAGRLPPNIKVLEFFFLAGRWLHVPFAQQHYISANYTHAASYLLARGLNVVLQLVAKRVVDGEARYSLSCNTDTTLDIMRARAEGRAAFRMYGQVNSELPFMPGPGDLPASEFAAILDSPATDFPLFAPPAEPISDTKYAIGLHAATLVARWRHLADRHRPGRRRAGAGLGGPPPQQRAVPRDHAQGFRRALPPREAGTFETGLYGVSEMVFEAFLGLIDAGILKRAVDGVILHGAFFLGPKAFYRALREMKADEIARIQMMPVSFTNAIYGDEDAKRRARLDARFVNNAMMATLMGAAVSDGLEDGQVISGVGGQYNFVAQAFALDGARSVLALEATRAAGRKTLSNIRWNYGHTTIPGTCATSSSPSTALPTSGANPMRT